MKDFILCPFRGLKNMWKEGPSGQWMVVLLIPWLIIMFAGLCFWTYQLYHIIRFGV